MKAMKENEKSSSTLGESSAWASGTMKVGINEKTEGQAWLVESGNQTFNFGYGMSDAYQAPKFICT